jgi:predicted dienelactone hydrolase
MSQAYDPFARGSYPVGVRSTEKRDAERNRLFPIEIWYPAAAHHAGQDLAAEAQDSFPVPLGSSPRRQMAVRDAAPEPGNYPLILFSHHAGGHRRASTFLCSHLSSHGYVVAALDHSEVLAPELGRQAEETEERKRARVDAVMTSRVADLLLLLDHALNGGSPVPIDTGRIGAIGHSLGGWAALALPDLEPRVHAIVALAPAGASNPRPGILPAKLDFRWGRDVPTLLLAAENDVCLPLSGMYEIFERTPATKKMAILHRADHMHFADNVEEIHEIMRHAEAPAEFAWLKEMKPISELCSGEEAYRFIRGLTLCHMDLYLRQLENARQFLGDDSAQPPLLHLSVSS